jgi:hypothetical protein
MFFQHHMGLSRGLLKHRQVQKDKHPIRNLAAEGKGCFILGYSILCGVLEAEGFEKEI